MCNLFLASFFLRSPQLKFLSSSCCSFFSLHNSVAVSFFTPQIEGAFFTTQLLCLSLHLILSSLSISRIAVSSSQIESFAQRYCLEATAKRLLSRFPSSNVFLIAPASLQNSIANFVHLTRPGFGLVQLDKLVSSTLPCEMVAFSR